MQLRTTGRATPTLLIGSQGVVAAPAPAATAAAAPAPAAVFHMEWRKAGVHGRKWLALKLKHSNPALPWFYVPLEDQRATTTSPGK